MLRTSEPDRVDFGLAQVRRLLVSPSLRALHVVFAPSVPRPLLLGLVRLENTSAEALAVDYTETWDVSAGSWHTAPGACERRGPGGVRALAEASIGIRAAGPEPPPRVGLALDVRIGLPPHAVRELSFAYVATPPDQSAPSLVRAFRGDVADELARTVRGWLERLGPGGSPVAGYRERIATLRG